MTKEVYFSRQVHKGNKTEETWLTQTLKLVLIGKQMILGGHEYLTNAPHYGTCTCLSINGTFYRIKVKDSADRIQNVQSPENWLIIQDYME